MHRPLWSLCFSIDLGLAKLQSAALLGETCTVSEELKLLTKVKLLTGRHPLSRACSLCDKF